MATITPSKPSADPVKHVFDNSHRTVFSAKAGQVLPVLAIETIANSDYEIDVQDLLRTTQLNQAAFIRSKQNVDFFFVPYSQLFTRFNQFLNQKHDPVIAGSKLAKYLPNFNLLELVLSVATTPESYDPSYCDMFDFPYRYQVGKILDLLGYGKVPLEHKLTKEIEGNTYINDVWYLYLIDYFGVSQSDFDSWVYNYSSESYTLKDNWIEILIGKSRLQQFRYQVNPFRVAAYCKIWNDFYRNPYRDEPLDPLYFNFDDIDCTTIESSDISSVREWTQFTDLFNMRYRRWKNDIFTASFPEAQFGAASFVSMSNNLSEVDYIALQDPKFTHRVSGSDSFSDTAITVGDSGVVTTIDGPYVSGGIVTSIFSNNISFGEGKIDMSFTIAALRQAVAMQHFGENAIRAGNRTPDNQRAHFGDAPVFDTDMHVKYLGTFDGTIDLNVVSSTGQSETQQGQSKFVGSLAANGISSLSGNKITFHAHDFGVIMACFSVLPEAEYNAIMCDKHNRKIEPFDFPFCELDDLGFQPIVKGDLGFPGQASNLPVGYAFPFAEYKTALDKVHGEFITLAVPIGGSGSPFPSLVKGSLVSYVSPRTQLQYEQLSDVRNLYVNPHLYDNIFGVAADAKESSDQFYLNMFFDVKSRLPLSVLGLPQYI